MAEYTTKQYASGADVVEDITPLWDWKKIEETDEGTCFWANEDACIIVSSTGKLTVEHKGLKVASTAGSGNYLSMQVIKTKSATIIKAKKQASLNLTECNDCIILGYERDLINGDSRATIATLFKREGYSNRDSYICAKNTSISEIQKLNWGAEISQGTYTRIIPFRIAEYPVIMENVYNFSMNQFGGFFTGDCTINGRKYVAIDYVCALDE